MSEPVFVSKEWVERVDAELKTDAPPQPVAPPPSSRFYDVRPVVVQSEWTQGGSLWSAEAAFVVNDAVDASFVFPVVAYGAKPSVSGACYAVWRGRWELLCRPGLEYSGGDGIDVDNINGVITNTGVTSAVIAVAGASTGATVNDGSILYFSDEDFRAGSRDTDSDGRSPCVALNAKRIISLVAGDGIDVTPTQYPGYKQYTISSTATPYVWPGITLAFTGGTLGNATTIVADFNSLYSPVKYASNSKIVFRNLTELTVVTDVRLTASGELVKDTRTIWAYPNYLN